MPADVDLHRISAGSLIELMIAIVVVGILAAIAVPAYNDSVRKSRRSDATSAITAVQQAQERWRNSRSSYADSLEDLGIAATSPSGYYTIAIDSADASSYAVSAVGVDGKSQADDGDCRKLSVRLQSGSLAYAGCGGCTGYTYTPTHACWAR